MKRDGQWVYDRDRNRSVLGSGTDSKIQGGERREDGRSGWGWMGSEKVFRFRSVGTPFPSQFV